MKLLFATRNKDKLEEARQILGVEVESSTLPIEEIQSLDNKLVASYKAKEYYKQLQTPLFVDDNGLAFEALGGLPGAYVGDFVTAVGVSGLLKLLKNEENRNATATVAIVYIDENGKEHTFIGQEHGTIALEERGTNGFVWDTIFIPNGSDKTYAEMISEEKNSRSMRRKALDQFKEYLDSIK